MPLVPPLRWSWKGTPNRVDPSALADAHCDFVIAIDEAVLAADPDDLEALGRLGESYTRRGRYVEGLAIDRRLVALLPDDPTAHYNLACSLALTGDPDAAFDALEAAVAHGYVETAHLVADEDLEALHDDPRWQALVDRLTDR